MQYSLLTMNRPLSRNCKAKNSPYGSRANNVDIWWARNKYPCVIVNEKLLYFVTHSLFPVRISKGMERRLGDRGGGSNMNLEGVNVELFVDFVCGVFVFEEKKERRRDEEGGRRKEGKKGWRSEERRKKRERVEDERERARGRRKRGGKGGREDKRRGRRGRTGAARLLSPWPTPFPVVFLLQVSRLP
ncbi:hypothetical protein Tco_0285201 [Tanacetum coccineum]